ncbi:Activity-regulated cytoskeleton associated protein 2 [Eumeta japonica]|uniref:Activity-regulated cytoskeleton associated protein 2 n=1 Tax=Eumeta variegata TaxID=151549 RepID=A0A4C1U1T6_EUMVA|nr:Activity-regulated cytoskeleton associated protein 2 [Eumeta japonica]
MPRKEHIEPATTARDDEHHDGSGIVTRAQAAAAASSDRLVGGTTVPVFDLRDGADPSPCMSTPTATPAPLLAGVSEDQLAALLSTLARSQAESIVFLYNHYWHRRRTAMERPRRPELCLGSPFCSAASARSGSFAKCTARFDGSASDPDVLETFLDAIEVYKECLNINDEHALRGLPILLTGNAAVWWRGIKSTVSTWPDAVYKLRSMYGVPRPAHKILGIFSLWNRVPCAPIYSLREFARFRQITIRIK